MPPVARWSSTAANRTWPKCRDGCCCCCCCCSLVGGRDVCRCVVSRVWSVSHTPRRASPKTLRMHGRTVDGLDHQRTVLCDFESGSGGKSQRWILAVVVASLPSSCRRLCRKHGSDIPQACPEGLSQRDVVADAVAVVERHVLLKFQQPAGSSASPRGMYISLRYPRWSARLTQMDPNPKTLQAPR